MYDEVKLFFLALFCFLIGRGTNAKDREGRSELNIRVILFELIFEGAFKCLMSLFSFVGTSGL